MDVNHLLREEAKGAMLVPPLWALVGVDTKNTPTNLLAGKLKHDAGGGTIGQNAIRQQVTRL